MNDSLARKILLIITLGMLVFISAQGKKDTAFTLNSEFAKQIRKYPFIKKVNPTPQTALKEEHNIVYATLSGRDVHLDAFIHPEKKLLPAVILIHGGGWKSGSKELQKPLAQQIALSGYQTFTLEYRLSAEAPYPAGINDIRAAIDYIKKNSASFNVVPKKIALLGCSSGGQMASLIGTKYPKEINAVIDIDGLLAFHHPDSEEGKSAADWLGGTYEVVPKIWEDASALTHVSENTPPFLFISSRFKRFTAGKAEMTEKLTQYGIYSEDRKIENSPHTFWLFEPWFDTTLRYINNFLYLNFKK
ncbi:alpha/beta hydrolase [Kaistella palustris]|uniref:alpha/beta hydrolase n=1 Tax=Kaistella palustris TaxID=493376 RepID=UPI0003FDB93A|nr:alpha/beta hydrolase [Kaistella palustris]